MEEIIPFKGSSDLLYKVLIYFYIV